METKKQNKTMGRMIFISVLLHFFILLHIAGIYKSQALSFIELSLQSFSKNIERNIPRPRKRPKQKKFKAPEKIELNKSFMADSDPSLGNSLPFNSGNIEIPEAVGAENINPGDAAFVEEKQYTSRNDYFEMLKMRIENARRYPESAIAGQIEGQVSVRFVITTDGQVSSLKISRRTRFESLNQAALDAVNNAAPFPRPPLSLFKGPLKVEIRISFELT